MSFEHDLENLPRASDEDRESFAHPRKPTLKAVPVESKALEELQTKVAVVRQIVRELRQLSEEACAVAHLIEGRIVAAAKDDNDDATLRLSFQALVGMLDDAEHEHMLSDRIDELVVMVGLEAAEVANG